MSSDKSSTVSNICVIFLTLFEKCMLLMLLINGMNSIDINHTFCLFIFVAFCVRPKWEKYILEFVIVYSMTFIAAKYVYTILIQQDDIHSSDVVMGQRTKLYFIRVIGFDV